MSEPEYLDWEDLLLVHFKYCPLFYKLVVFLKLPYPTVVYFTQKYDFCSESEKEDFWCFYVMRKNCTSQSTLAWEARDFLNM